jgi:hypothetical protein
MEIRDPYRCPLSSYSIPKKLVYEFRLRFLAYCSDIQFTGVLLGKYVYMILIVPLVGNGKIPRKIHLFLVCS